ncbi:hypothetical protein GGS24DRAFT_450978 [Hypoxylon argillaceum]|nr:hypothetical protein GGS24DRAFT_450978 [Hypoxylon argillaceum]
MTPGERLFSAAAIFSGTVLPATSRTLDSIMMPSSDGHRDSRTNRLYGSHWLGTASPFPTIVRVPRCCSSTTQSNVLLCTL